jgi:hypothetical protein
VHLALPDAAPPDAVEIAAIDESAEAERAGRPVGIHVVQRAARIEAGREPQAHTAAQPPERVHRRLLDPEPDTPRAERRQRPRQAHVLVARVAPLVGIEQRRGGRFVLERLLDEPRDLVKYETPVLLVQDVVVHARVRAHRLLRRTEVVEETPLLLGADHPIRAAGQDERGRSDRAGIVHDAPRGIAHAKQHIDGDRARNERILVVAPRLLLVVGEHGRLDVALHE